MIVQTKDGSIGTMMVSEAFRWLSPKAMETQALGCYIRKHQQIRMRDLSLAFQQHAIPMEPQDFVLTFYTEDALGFPTAASTIRMHGRPSFSIEKAPRIPKSPPLLEDEEVHGMFTLLIILCTIHRHIPIDQWTINMQVSAISSFCSMRSDHIIYVQVQVVFFQTDICATLLKTRTDHVAVLAQIRRWLAFCKALAKKSNLFTLPPEDRPFVADHQLSENRLKCMNRKGAILWAKMSEWLQNGERAPSHYPLAPQSSAAPTPAAPAKDWIDAVLLKHTSSHQQEELLVSSDGSTSTSPSTLMSPPLLPSDITTTSRLFRWGNNANEELQGIIRESKNDLQFIDEMRVRVLTALTANEAAVPRIKKAQKCFEVLAIAFPRHCFFCAILTICASLRQQLAQNIVTQRRNFKTLENIAERLDAIMTRIQGVETGTEKVFDTILEQVAAEPQSSKKENAGEEAPPTTNADENPNKKKEVEEILKFKNLILARMERIERDARPIIQDIIQPSAEFIRKKRKLMEVDDFLDAFLHFLLNSDSS